MNCKERLEAYLEEHRIPFRTHHHPEVFTAQEVAATEHVPGRILGKAVVVWADGNLVLTVLPAPLRVDLDKAPAALGAEMVRLATEEEFAPYFPGCATGAIPPFGNLFDIPVFVDSALTRHEDVVFEAGTHTDTIRMRYADFERVVGPTVADLARPV
jgi:Ala-tRNA(Pro) deacylase